MQVGPPDPLIPISLAGYVWTSQPARRQRGGGPRIALGDDHDARADGEHVAAERRELVVRDLDEPDPEVPEELQQPHRAAAAGRRRRGRRRPARSPTAGGRAPPARASTGTSKIRTSPPTIVGQLASAVVVGPQRPPDAQAGRVGARTCRRPRSCPARSIRPSVGMPAARRPRLERRGLGSPVGLARPERDGATVGDQQRVEGVDQVGIVGLVVEDVDPSARAGRASRRRRRALAGRAARSTGGGTRASASSNAAPNAGPGSLDQHLAQRRGHALRAVRSDHRRHGPKDRAPKWGLGFGSTLE